MPCTKPSVGVEFNEPSLNANPCAFVFDIRLPKIQINLPTIPFPPDFLPKWNLSLKLTCSLDNPIDVSGGITFGGGRLPCFETSPDDIPD